MFSMFRNLFVVAALAVSFTGCGEGGSSGPVVTDIKVNVSNASIAKGNSISFTATAVYDDNSTKDISDMTEFVSSHPNIIVADSNSSNIGLFHAVSLGSAVISGVYTSFEANTSIEVTDAELVSLNTSPSEVSLAKGQEQQLSAIGLFTDDTNVNIPNSVVWRSSDETVATVTASGLLQTHQVGVVDIYANQGNIESNAQTVTVGEEVLESLSLSTDKSLVYVSDMVQLSVTGTMSDGTKTAITSNVIWNSSNTSVATINSSGLLIAKNAGSTSVTAVVNNIQATMDITVELAYITGISFDSIGSLEEGTTKSLQVTGTYNDGTSKDVTSQVSWQSSNSSIASVSGTTLRGYNAGTATITATLDGFSMQNTVTVTPEIWYNHMSVRTGSGATSSINGVVQAGSWMQFSLLNESKSNTLKVTRLFGTDKYGRSFIDQDISENLSAYQGVGYTITLRNDVASPVVGYEVQDTSTGLKKTFTTRW